MTVIWVNGKLSKPEKAVISPLDHGILVGDGVFETICVYDRVPFAWRRHYERLLVSAAGLGLAVPASSELLKAASEVIAGSDLDHARLRVTITGGPGPLGSERTDAPETVIVAIGTIPDWADAEKCVVVPWRRNEYGATTGLKTISYAENVRALNYARLMGAGEAIFLNTRGNICEATGSNIFFVKDEVLVTPPLSSGCLAGVTRDLVLLLAKNLGIATSEQDLPFSVVSEVSEAFLTSTTREVQAIAQIDDIIIPNSSGVVVKHLSEAYTDLRRRECDP